MAELLRAHALCKSFQSGGERIVPVDGVDLVLSSGDVVLITGPSGSGKTTLLQMLVGFQLPDSGSVRWTQAGPGETPTWDDVAMVPQSLGLLPELTVAENVALPLIANGRSGDTAARVAAVLRALDVAALADRLVRETSLGQQQRVAVARALVSGPRVIVADEPTSHQDADHAIVVLRALRDAAAAGSACLMAGHDPRLVDAADRVLHLDEGRLATGV